MKIAMLGTRGIPASYSGFETAVEALSTRLVWRGHEVVVYSRPHVTDFTGESYEGVRLKRLPTIATKHLDTFVHTGISTLDMLLRDRCDVAIYFIAGNSPFCFLSRLGRIPTLINVDGMDSKRDKWSPSAKAFIRFAERLAPAAANVVIADSRVVQRHYKEQFDADSVFIPYGAHMERALGTEWLDRFGLSSREYVLFVGRLVPENCPHVLIEAFQGIRSGKKLVIVGDAPYAGEYIAALKQMAGDSVIFTGFVFGEGYRQLSQNAYLSAAPTVVGGTHPVIVESLAAGNCVLVSDHPPNLESIGDAGVSFAAAEGAAGLRRKLQQLLDDPGLVAGYREKGKERAHRVYDWDSVTDQYEDLCRQVVGGVASGRAANGH